MAELTAQDIIAKPGLSRHPEGGWYSETYRLKMSLRIDWDRICWWDSVRRLLCPPITGKLRKVWDIGHWSDAPLPRPFSLKALKWPRLTGVQARLERVNRDLCPAGGAPVEGWVAGPGRVSSPNRR